ncbi:MAG TPA: response regulator [Polyangiaceae bacterium]|nr:response regulator [Polyangiaceae bacterium]
MYVLASVAPQRAANMGKRVLVLDDNAVSCNVVVTILGEAGYQTDTRGTTEDAFEALARGQHRVLIADQHRGPIDGLAVARRIQEQHPSVSIILLTGDKTLPASVDALQSGVFDFMTRSFDLSSLAEHLLDAVHRTFGDQLPISERIARSSIPVPRDPVQEVLVGDSTAIERARQDVRAASGSDAPVLIVGENGTEKVPVARLIHSIGPRHKEPFEIVNTAQIDDGTDFIKAVRTWSDARRGTLFFADVSTLNSVWQVELVKLLSGLGPNPDAPRPRIIAGLGHPPDEAWEGSVLARLFQRLGCTQVMLPPLRERGRDVVILAEHFAEQSRLARGDAALRITPTALEAMSRYAWPGNVEELRFALQHAASLCGDSIIRVVDLPPGIGLSLKGASDESGSRLEVQSLEDMELSYILRVLEAVGGNKASAARLLGVDRTTLYRKLQRQEHAEPASEAGPISRRVRSSK